MITFANTKSISRLNAERRFSFSAASLHTRPMPSSMPTLTMKLSSASSRSLNPASHSNLAPLSRLQPSRKPCKQRAVPVYDVAHLGSSSAAETMGCSQTSGTAGWSLLTPAKGARCDVNAGLGVAQLLRARTGHAAWSSSRPTLPCLAASASAAGIELASRPAASNSASQPPADAFDDDVS